MDARLEAAQNGARVLEAPAVVVPEVQPFLGVVEDGVGPSVPKAPRNWSTRDRARATTRHRTLISGAGLLRGAFGRP